MSKRAIFAKLGIIFLVGSGLVLNSSANGIYGDGVGAQSMAMGGADVAWSASPLSAMGENPAGMGFLGRPQLDLGGVGLVAQGNFDKPGVSSGSLEQNLNALPEAAFGLPLGSWPVTLGLSFIPQSALLADWHYLDPPGGLNGTTSYGDQKDKSEIVVLRSALGAAVRLGSKFSFGASAGLIYNENVLEAPYIFQNLQPGPGGPNNTMYNGAKTLLNLRTSGFGGNAQAGMMFKATETLQFGVSYLSETTVHTSGEASGDPSLQFGHPQGTLPFHYDADVRNKFPQEVSAGSSWKFLPSWRAAVQVDWIDWADAFRTLPVSLYNGNNAGVNAALGSSFTDLVPLNWKDEFVYRAGLEFDVARDLALRVGFCHGNSPVPSSALTPLTAAIVENTFTAGIGYHWNRFQFDLAYQYCLPQTQSVGVSGLRSGEYSFSSTEVSIHTIAITTSVRF